MAASFRDLRVWQEAYGLTIELYKATKDFPNDEAYGLTTQLRRAAVSVMANIAEGHHRSSHKERIQFLVIARGSVEEIRSHLSVAIGLEYISKSTFENLENRYSNLGRGINSFILALRKQNS